MIWRCAAFEFDTNTPIIMGVLNVTPDSFSDGGEYLDEGAALSHAEEMLAQGASIIDVGGESSRPGATEVAPDEEWARIGGVVAALAKRGVCVSVDTRHHEVARRALDAGCSIINDISGFSDPQMRQLAVSSEAGLVVMHMQGTPETMQDDPSYDDVVDEVSSFLREQADLLIGEGVDPARICVDPGPGFGKTYQQTVELMRNIHEFVHLGFPVMAAPSRKSYVSKAYRIDAADRKALDEASAAEALLACELGASVVRCHDVQATRTALEGLRPYAILGLGSNVALVAEEGEETEAKKAQINLAIGQLVQLPDSQIVDIAPFYGSKPAYYEDQEDFVNTVVLLRTGIPPKELLGYLHSIEGMLGRMRDIENGPRTLDIDIIDYQLYDYATEELTLPHVGACERDFVVKPILDILPGHVLANGHRIDEIAEADRVGRAWRA